MSPRTLPCRSPETHNAISLSLSIISCSSFSVGCFDIRVRLATPGAHNFAGGRPGGVPWNLKRSFLLQWLPMPVKHSEQPLELSRERNFCRACWTNGSNVEDSWGGLMGWAHADGPRPSSCDKPLEGSWTQIRRQVWHLRQIKATAEGNRLNFIVYDHDDLCDLLRFFYS